MTSKTHPFADAPWRADDSFCLKTCRDCAEAGDWRAHLELAMLRVRVCGILAICFAASSR